MIRQNTCSLSLVKYLDDVNNVITHTTKKYSVHLKFGRIPSIAQTTPLVIFRLLFHNKSGEKVFSTPNYYYSYDYFLCFQRFFFGVFASAFLLKKNVSMPKYTYNNGTIEQMGTLIAFANGTLPKFARNASMLENKPFTIQISYSFFFSSLHLLLLYLGSYT